MFTKIGSPKLIGVVFVLGFAPLLSAQLSSGLQTITVTAQSAESIGISLNVGGPVSITLPNSLGKVTNGNVVPAWTTSWVLSSSRTAVKVYAFFSGTTALTGLNPINTIPAVDFFGQANGGAFTAFSTAAVAPVAIMGTGMLVSTTPITSANLTAMKSDSLVLSLTSNTTVFATDTYTGVLNIQAQATP
ncbi:MAG: hypothetical protein JWO80_2946 [Bryobacterales bacterium]|nr:hypothetical protein [Bryobacterales bacterium]